MTSDPRASLPGVDRLLADPALEPLLAEWPRGVVVQAIRGALDEVRAELADDLGSPVPADGSEWAARVRDVLAALDRPSLRRVVNATGVVLHTNLGRAPLAEEARAAMQATALGYSNLEFDLESGRRGSRYVHCVDLLREITGAEDALVVNNCAAALVLALSTVGRGLGVAVSRGELVEIGGGFRIPEMLEQAGSTLVEVGATNRTRTGDYAAALESGAARAVLKVHRSNFRISGFTESAPLTELVELGAPVVYDLGSGLFVRPDALGLPEEPTPMAAVAAGVDLVVVSGDKLLGGPQAGIVLGRADWVGRMRSNPLCRALRVDKVTLAGLEATLRLYRDPRNAIARVPTLRMISAPAGEVAERARAVAEALGGEGGLDGVTLSVVEGASLVGGGTFPGVEIPSAHIRLLPDGADGLPDAAELARRLRSRERPVVGRVEDDALLLDLRTVEPGEDTALVEALSEVTGR
jgi:L-seryl-tRNA(Ser) seleniumtransferase